MRTRPHARRVDLASLLGISAFSLDRLLEVDPKLLVSIAIHASIQTKVQNVHAA